MAAVELDDKRSLPMPVVLLAQARLAARRGVGLDTVLRRYFCGYSLLCEFLIEEMEGDKFRGKDQSRDLLRSQAAHFDRLLVAITEEYNREQERSLDPPDDLRTECVKRLLAGERLDPSELTYDFGAHHVGVVAVGPTAAETVQGLTSALDCRLLLVPPIEETVWAWLGARRPLDLGQIMHLTTASVPEGVSLAFGESGQGVHGWRLTHRQAKAALPIALRGLQNVIRYADVAVLASIIKDDLLSTSLREIYLVPLEHGRDGGKVLRKTLRAYFAAGRNGASAAAALGVSRQTVTNRLRVIEERLGRSFMDCAGEIEAALHLDDVYSLPR